MWVVLIGIFTCITVNFTNNNRLMAENADTQEKIKTIRTAQTQGQVRITPDDVRGGSLVRMGERGRTWEETETASRLPPLGSTGPEWPLLAKKRVRQPHRQIPIWVGRLRFSGSSNCRVFPGLTRRSFLRKGGKRTKSAKPPPPWRQLERYPHSRFS